MAAAGRRHVGDAPAAKTREQLPELRRLGTDLRRRVIGAAAAGRVQVERWQPTGSRSGIVDSHRGRLAGRLGRERAGKVRPPSRDTLTCGVPASQGTTERHAARALCAVWSACGSPS